MKDKRLIKKHKDIARIDQASKQTYGWYVRVRFNGETHSKFFSDIKHGGRASSLLVAIAWRDQIEISLGKLRTDKRIAMTTKTKSGVVGVRLNEKLNRYEVSWVDKNGKPGKTTVSILKHGEKKAFQIACEKRLQKETERLC